MHRDTDTAEATDLVSKLDDISIRVERLTAYVNELNRQTETSMKEVVILLALAVIIGGS